MARTLLVVNPNASAVDDERASRVAAALGADVAVVSTERPGHATDLVRDADAAAVVVFGGDGAFNEALNGLRPQLPIGFVPGGGSSVLPRALGLSREPERAAQAVAEALRAGRTRTISLGSVNGRRFAFAAAVGFPAEVVRRVDDRGRPRGRRASDGAFLVAAAQILREVRWRIGATLEVEGRGRAAFALVANGDPYTYFRRIPIRAAPAARWESGLDLVAPREVRPGTIPRLVAGTLAGRTDRTRGVLYVHDADELVIRADRPTALQVDGEDLGDVELARFAVEREAAKVLI